MIVPLIIALAMALRCMFLVRLDDGFASGCRLVKRLYALSAEVTHNHPEGIKGAMATVDAIYMPLFLW